MLRLLAKYQIEAEEKNKSLLTLNSLSEYMVENMIVSSQKQAKDLLVEPIDHELVIVKNTEGKEFYKVNLQYDVLEKLANGEYDDIK